MKARTLSHAEARRAYDRIGRLQDSQAFYEDAATDRLLRHGDFASARSVFEFGCGTGRFAQHLFEEWLPAGARYRGVDLSPRMVGLAQARLRPWAPRAAVRLSDGGPPSDEPSAACDRFVSSYVFDLLAIDEILAVLREAHRMLEPAACSARRASRRGRARVPAPWHARGASCTRAYPRCWAVVGPSTCCPCSRRRPGKCGITPSWSASE